MDHPSSISAQVWREACLHIELDSAVTAIARAIAPHGPFRALVVARADATTRTIETLAVGITGKRLDVVSRTPPLPVATWQKVIRWLRDGTVERFGASARLDWLQGVVPPDIDGEILAGPLCTQRGQTGLVLLIADRGRSFEQRQVSLATHLLEPLAVALENDARFHELKALREAAEADRETLLSRLGRQGVNEDVVGVRTGLRTVMDRVELVAQADVPVLILGETGTGKEVVSRAIHTRSKRADGPFIRVNCGAIPAELIDSQLFGHEKGSFTGAADQHQGWFERADRGTLFLDEIGELPLPAQVRLLRVLQDHQIERVGGKSPVHVDVRIVAATHRDLAAMVQAKTFREDLWYRINIFPILLPTLRERLEDIPALVRHFAQRAAVRFGLPPVEPTPADLQQLAAYDWPGNIRELGAVIDRAAILGGGRRLDVGAALGLGRQPLAPPPRPPADATLYEVVPEDPPTPLPPPAGGAPAGGEIVSLATAMRQHIERALVATRGRIEGKRGAAALLDINPHTLRARMRKLRIDVESFRE
ncbi:MAG: sigma-54 interaction domain-containing protein [Planctomycetia bacterium]|jgi:hydrogenase-4 transcriptional activator